MNRVVNGIHIGNTRQWHIEDMCRTDHGRGAMTILHHLMFPRDEVADQWGDAENQFWYWKLRHGWASQGIPPAPERLIHIRLYHPEWMRLDPRAWARHSVQLLSNWRFEGLHANLWDDPLVCISPANEQDIEGYGPGGAANTVIQYERIGRWNLDFWDEVDRLIPGRRALSCWSALAGGHDAWPDRPDSEYEVPAIRDAIQRCDIGAVHLYGHMEWGPNGNKTLPGGSDAYWHMLRAWRPKGWREANQASPTRRPPDRGGYRAQFPNQPFIISEAGTFAHSDRNRTAQTLEAMRGLLMKAAMDPLCLGVTWFIWSTDSAHPTNNIMQNPQLRDSIRDLPAYETNAKVPSRTKPKPQESSMDFLPALKKHLSGRFHDVRDVVLARGNPYRYTDPKKMKRIVIHHTGGPRDQGWELIDDFHRAPEPNGRGWPGIGYNWYIHLGKVYFVGDAATERAHTWGRNNDSLGICVSGRYDGETRPAQEDILALVDLVAAIDETYGRQLELLGHGAAALPGRGTACPGGMLKIVIPSLRNGGLTMLGVAALQAAERAHVLPINPEAALVKAIAAAGMWPTSPETTFTHNGVTYHVQRGESPAGQVAAFYCQKNDWGNVRRVNR